ncbi:AI-2E family transporter [Halieaceae bacterium IMCC14734]|uniref:AI-2E family transporter n=1 Tax=Candidatus Litorirhabdus singularis TaxID=2518993 RepID=A0ABT3TF14_9GAMM|nr:AI-2E family transporter [Candidatus Litorirhabdus singularis]MCX2980371.1 AI-2E family transporter [Candidatus Litorirhabdus singularis]
MKQSTEDHVTRSIEIFIRLGLIIALVIWCFQILQPFITTIVWGMIIAIALQPPFNWLLARMGYRYGLTAAILTVIAMAALLTPAIELSTAMVQSASNLTESIRDGSYEVPPAPDSVREWPFIGDQVHTGWSLASNNLQAALQQYSPQLRKAASWTLSTAAGAGLGLLQFAISIIVAGFFLAYSKNSADFARRLGRRLAGETGEKYAALASTTVTSVAQGVLGVAFIQALLAGIGFVVMDIPGAGLWTLLVLILGIVQLSPGLIIIPTVIYVFTTASTPVAIAYLIWGIAVGLVDNILKPILLGRGVPVPMAVIFLGAIGGFITTGFVGLFVGAVVMVMGYDLFMIWLTAGETDEAIEAIEAAPKQG